MPKTMGSLLYEKQPKSYAVVWRITIEGRSREIMFLPAQMDGMHENDKSLKIRGFQAGVFRYASKHLRTNFIAIMKCPYVIGKFACFVSEFLM
jgi:hypothetical protein